MPMFFLELKNVIKTLLIAIGGFGPFISAMINTKFIRKEPLSKWLRSTFKFKIRFKWYLIALLIPFLLRFLTLAIVRLTTNFEVKPSLSPSIINYPIYLLFVTFLGGGQEEPGWRGYAVSKFSSKIIGSLIIGVMWTFWHIPLFLMEGTVQSSIPFFWYFLNTIGFSLIFTNLFIQSKSVVPPILLHAGLNSIANFIPIIGGLSLVYPYIVVSTYIIAIVFEIFVRNNLKK